MSSNRMAPVDVGVLDMVLSMEDDEGGKGQRGTDGDVITIITVPESNGYLTDKERHCELWNGRVYRGVYAGKEEAASVDDDADDTLPSCGDIGFCVEEDVERCGSDGKE
jgi:hypothetical protein